MKLGFSRQVFQKYLDIKFHENLSSGSRVPCGRTNSLDEANSCFSQFLRMRLKMQPVVLVLAVNVLTARL
jgi:hypothetical protein